MLLDAQKLGYPVDQDRIDDAITYIGNELTNRYRNMNKRSSSYRYYRNAEAYFHYVMALAGKVERDVCKRWSQIWQMKSYIKIKSSFICSKRHFIYLETGVMRAV